jgi:hypothetical protein
MMVISPALGGAKAVGAASGFSGLRAVGRANGGVQWTLDGQQVASERADERREHEQAQCLPIHWGFTPGLLPVCENAKRRAW